MPFGRTLARSNYTLLDWVPGPQGRGDFGGSANFHLPTYDSSGGSTNERFRVLPNYLGHMFRILYR